MTAVETDPKRTESGNGMGVGVTLLRVAWLAILLGVAMEILLLVLAMGFGDVLGLRSLAADLVKSVSWSVIVCAGLAVGTTISRIRLPMMGMLGVLAAPLAFEVSRVFHKGTTQALEISGSDPIAASPLVLALLKGLEYGCLGLLIAWVGGHSWGGLKAHIGIGFAVGLTFGGAMTALTYRAAPELFSAADLISRGLNEVLFPIGCALVLFSAGVIADKASGQDRPRTESPDEETGTGSREQQDVREGSPEQPLRQHRNPDHTERSLN